MDPVRCAAILLVASSLGCAEPAPIVQLAAPQLTSARIEPPPASAVVAIAAAPVSAAAGPTVGYCSQEVPVDAVEVSCNAIEEVGPLRKLSKLRRLQVAVLPEMIVDLGDLHQLEELRIHLSSARHGTTAQRSFDLTPLQQLSSLKRLAIWSHLLTDLSSLAKMTHLTALSVAGCENVRDVAPLSQLTHLSHLDLFRTSVTDLAPLSNMMLTSLNVGHTRVSRIEVLAQMTSLVELNLAGTDVKSIAPLANLSKLEALDLTHSLVEDRSVLMALPALKRLLLGYNKGVDLDVLSRLSAIEVLYLDGNGLGDVSRLKVLRSLRQLSLADNRAIVDVTPLLALRHLEALDITRTGVNKAEVRAARPKLALRPYYD